MSIPLNPAAFQEHSSITTLAQAQRWIDGFSRPDCFNTHAWSTTKRLALLVWKCHLEKKHFNRTLNFLHPTFYDMIRTPEGENILNERRLRRFVA